MRAKKLLELAGDLVRINAAFVRSGKRRGELREALKIEGYDHRLDALIRDDVAAAPATALPYERLSETSLALAGIRTRPGGDHLNVVVGEVRTAGVFAGVRTALTVGDRLASALGLRLRIVMVDATSLDNSPAKVAAYLKGIGLEAEVVMRERTRETAYGESDLWLATHFKTAHAVQVACEVGVIDADRVVYLVQDYEPGFTAWGTTSVLAQATYHAGFTPIVNSRPLFEHLRAEEQLTLDDSVVFAPSFELETLAEVAAARRPKAAGAPLRVLFYGRRSKPRNLFALGVSALKALAAQPGFDASRVEFFSAGEQHDDVPLGGDAALRSLGRLPWDRYFQYLSTVDVMLSLQQSPHPSHPPFDAAISGAVTVTNDFHGTRAGLHPRIIPVRASTESLAAGLAEALRRVAAPGFDRGYLPVSHGVLGHPLDEVIAHTAATVRTRRG